MHSSEINRELLMELYADEVLRNGTPPASVYQFCQQHQIAEPEFYACFGSFRNLEQSYFPFFMERTFELISGHQYSNDDAKERLLTFYFTFFEQLAINRSLILYLLQERRSRSDRWRNVQSAKKLFSDYIKNLALPHYIKMEEVRSLRNFRKVQSRATADVFWVHLLSVLKFWLEDDSPRLEKTDVYIEKSVDTAFSLLDISPARKLADLGKFLYHEKIRPFI